MASTDDAWEAIARRDPYWGVLSSDEYVGARLDDETERRFFQSGADHIAHVLDVLRTRVDPGFAPRTAIDYGCGVGRLLVPLGRSCERVIGVDVSATMLGLAREHVDKAGVANVDLRAAGDLAAIEPQVDLVHSVLVLQHIPPATGMAILETLLHRLAPGGCGAIQFHFRGAGGQPVRLLRRWRERSSLINRVIVRASGRPARDTLVLVHEYDSTAVLRALAASGAENVWIETTALPSGHTDSTVYFQRQG